LEADRADARLAIIHVSIVGPRTVSKMTQTAATIIHG
jgi:hypothetical protein